MKTLVEASALKKYFRVNEGWLSRGHKLVYAVDGVDLQINEGETVGLVGESGCGKTTLARLLLGLIEPTSGSVSFSGWNIFNLSKKDMRKLRREMQIIFQNPYASLNPRKTIRHILSQPYCVHKLFKKKEIANKTSELLEIVGLNPPELYLDRYPHEFSGGQRQRIVIARAIALNPRFIVADEPVSALDISIRAQILNLMKKLQTDFNLTYLFISHDLSVVRSVSDRVAVMYLGDIVEVAETEELYENPLHPYTNAIISATPIPNPRIARKRKRLFLKGEPPSPINPPVGCRFNPRCPNCRPECKKTRPVLTRTKNDHFVACNKTGVSE